MIATIVNTGTLTLPTSTDTLVGRATTDTLTNKTMTSTTNNVTASALFSATTTVAVSAATAPTAGQVLTATSGTAATWSGFAPSYAHFYSIVSQPFNTSTPHWAGFENTMVATSDITIAGTTDSIITLSNAGTYTIDYGIYVSNTNSGKFFSIQQNGTNIPGSLLTMNDGSSMQTMGFTYTFGAGDQIRLWSNVTATQSAPGGTGVTVAYLRISRLA